jgi:hypothetical protein
VTQYTDDELNMMCLSAENTQLKTKIVSLEEENLRLKNELLELSSQMQGMIYEN